MQQTYTVNFYRDQLIPVIEELNSGNELLLKFVNTWIAARRDMSRWRFENPKLDQRLATVKLETVLDADTRDARALFLRLAHGPKLPTVTYCLYCGAYFISGFLKKRFCCHPHQVQYAVDHHGELDAATRLAHLHRLLEEKTPGVDWLPYVLEKAGGPNPPGTLRKDSRRLSRWFLTRAANKGYISRKNGRLTEKAYSLFKRLEFPR
jgi:hypothetical protein